jgi:hypothetical protein
MNDRSIGISCSSPFGSKSKSIRGRGRTVGSRASGKLIESLENRTLFSAAVPAIVRENIATPADVETPLGVFGVVNGRETTLKVSLDSTHSATFSLSGGTATALRSDTGIDLEVTDFASDVLTAKVTHGGGVTFSKVAVTGSLKTFSAASSILAGTLSVSGAVGTVNIGAIPGNVTIAGGVGKFIGGNLAGTLSVGGNIGTLQLAAVNGNVNAAGNISTFKGAAVSGTIYSGGQIGHATLRTLTGRIVSASQIANFAAASMNGAIVLAGANLGSDGLLGGSGPAQDSFAAGTISVLRVLGPISASFIGAGVDPVDGVFGNGNDTSAGTGLVKSVSAASADSTTRFESIAFGVAKIGKQKIIVTIDPRFIVL